MSVLLKRCPNICMVQADLWVLWSRAFAFICWVLKRFRDRWRENDSTERARGTNKVITAVEVCSAVTWRRYPGGAAEEGAVRGRRGRHAAGPLLCLCPERVVKLRFKCPELLKRTCSTFVCVCCFILSSTILILLSKRGHFWEERAFVLDPTTKDYSRVKTWL